MRILWLRWLSRFRRILLKMTCFFLQQLSIGSIRTERQRRRVPRGLNLKRAWDYCWLVRSLTKYYCQKSIFFLLRKRMRASLMESIWHNNWCANVIVYSYINKVCWQGSYPGLCCLYSRPELLLALLMTTIIMIIQSKSIRRHLGSSINQYFIHYVESEACLHRRSRWH